MERSKPAILSRAKSKIAQHPSDLYALGSKSSISTALDSKRPGVIHGKSTSSAGSTSSSTSSSTATAASSSTSASSGSTGSVSDRKKEAPPIQSLIPPKKSKLTSNPRGTISSAEAWEVVSIDCEPADLVPMVLDANDNDEGDKVIGLICGAIKTLKNQRWKPDQLLYMGLLYLAKIRASIFSNDCILHALSSLLKRDQAHNFKSKGNPLVPVLAANLLMKGFNDKKNWPDIFVKLYIEDALGERVWVDNGECKCFSDNILTGFNTRHPPKSALQHELSVLAPRDCHSPSATIDDDDTTTITSSSIISNINDKDKSEYNVSLRYAYCNDTIENIVVESVKEVLNRRQPDAITKNFLKFLSSASGLVEIRNMTVSRLEMWLHNPKLMKPAQELLIYICYNCTTHTQKDVEIISQLVKMRLKTKSIINLYLNGVKELISLHPQNLYTMFKHTIYNELSNARNPNNMSILSVMFQNSSEISAKLLAEIFQEILMNRDDNLRSIRALYREIIRICRHDVNILIIIKTLMQEHVQMNQQLLTQESKERMFISIIDLLCHSMFLAISPQIKEAVLLNQRVDKKDYTLIQQFQTLISTIQYEIIHWLQTTAQKLYTIGRNEILHAIQKIMILESPEQYYRIDNWPPETDRVLFMRIICEVPLLQSTLIRLLMMGFSKDNGLTHSDILEITDQLIRRAAINSNDVIPMLQAEELNIIDLIFNLCVYQPPGSINIPAGYVPPSLAISNLYWKGWIMLLILAAHNPGTIGDNAWKRYPILRTLMEMCITNHFSYPPPTMALPEIIELERTKELQVETIEKQDILEYESHLAAASTRVQISESNSLLLSQLINLNPTGIARRPPQSVLEQVQSLNVSHRLGRLLCKSRKPDFLLDIIQRQQQSSSQSMPWLAELVQNSESSLSQLPVQCLCEFLLSTTAQALDKQPRQQQLLSHLQKLLTDPNEDQQQPYEVLEYFLRRLGSQQSNSRLQAITGLKLVLETIQVPDIKMEIDDEDVDDDNDNDEDDDDDDDDEIKVRNRNKNRKKTREEKLFLCNEIWLLRKLPSIPHFPAVRTLLSTTLRSACQVENNPELVRAYISYLAEHTAQDDLPDLTDLANEISQLVVERSTITAAILPEPDNECPKAKLTLKAFKKIFFNYLEKARSPRSESYTWSESQDQILVQWSTGEECTMHILVVHAMIILLTYDVDDDRRKSIDDLLEIWFPEFGEPPRAFLVDTSEEALLIPDWLKLRMIRSNVPRLVDAALKDLEPQQLVLFIQSFGIPVTSMSKLLHTLDVAVQIDARSVGEAVLDKTYMAQLVKVQHRRGATGGLVFVQVLQLLEPKLPENPIILTETLQQPFPEQTMIKKSSSIQNTIKTDIPHLINKIFIDVIPLNQKAEAWRRLNKILINDLQKSIKENGAVVLTIQYICTVLNSIQVKTFLSSLIHLPHFSCTLLRIILITMKTKNISNHIIGLCKNMCINLITLIGDTKTPILSILNDFINVNKSKTVKRNELIEFKQDKELSVILENTDPMNLENIGRILLDICIKEQKNDCLVEAMAKLLVADNNDGLIKPRTGLLIDWLASVEPDLIGVCPTLQMKLLFGKTKTHIKIDDESIINSHACRPYLLTLLTHRASWITLYKCVNHLLEKYDDAYDPTAVLDFLWALTCNPKLWQGRDKFTPKHYVPENILLLTEKQLLTLIAYLLAESIINYNNRGRNLALMQIESRLDLLQHCLATEDKFVSSIVKYLAERMLNHDNQIESDMAHQFLLFLYMKIPKVICYLNQFESNKFLSHAKINDWNGSVLDCMSHSLLTALAATPRQKSWTNKSQEFELCARKMAVVHPILVLRQLSMLSSSLTGRCYLNLSEFKSGHHLNLFTQVMGLLELLQPYVFNEEYRAALEDTLDNYIQCFYNYGQFKDHHQLIPLLNRFVTFLQAYISHDAQSAFKYLNKHVQTLRELKTSFGHSGLRTLIASISDPKEGVNGEEVFIGAPPPPLQFEVNLPQHWPSLVSTLSKIQGEDVYSALQEIEHLSSKKPSILEYIIDSIGDLLVSPQGNIRVLSHNLLARAMKHRPIKNPCILSAFQKCLDSPKSDVLMSALDRLPDFVLCMQEHALPLMQKVFELGVQSNVNTIPYINKSILLLNIQQGC